MKIAYIVDSIIPSHTANSIHVMKMAEAFKRNGEDVTLIAPSFSNRDESKDSNDIYGIKDRFEIVWIPFGRGILKTVQYVFHALNYAKKIKADIVYTRICQCAALASFMKLSYVLEMHQIPQVFQDKISMRIIRNAKTKLFLVVITRAIKEWVMTYGISENEARVYPDAVDVEQYPQPVHFSEKRNERIKVGYCGNLYRGKGIELIIPLAKELTECDFNIAGGCDLDRLSWQKIIEKEEILNISFQI